MTLRNVKLFQYVLATFLFGIAVENVVCDYIDDIAGFESQKKSHEHGQQEEHAPARPYAFGYAAGRFPGHIDRTHSEISTGRSGVIQGSYSYVDPKAQIRTVDYVADKDGFHPVLSHSQEALPRDSAAVAAAKERHHKQFAAIAHAHQNQHEQRRLGLNAAPRDSVAVAKAKNKHYDLYQKIAAEHARLGAQLELEKEKREREEHEARLAGKYAEEEFHGLKKL